MDCAICGHVIQPEALRAEVVRYVPDEESMTYVAWTGRAHVTCMGPVTPEQH